MRKIDPKYINGIIQNHLTDINQALDTAIETHGLDPAGGSESHRFSPGSVDLGVCKATVYASYTAKGLAGLSTLEFSTLEVVKLDIKSDYSAFKATGKFKIGTKKALSAFAYGKIGAKCGWLSLSEKLGAGASISGCEIEGTVEIHGELEEEGKITAIDLHLSETYVGSVKAHIEPALPYPLNKLVDALVSGLATSFTGLVTVAGPPVINAMNHAFIDKVLPIIFSLPDE